MKNINCLLRLDFASKFGYGKRMTPKVLASLIAKIIFGLGIYALTIFLAYNITKIFVLNSVEIGYSYLVVVLFAIQILQIFISTSSLIKGLYYGSDNELYLRFPISGSQIFAAKSISSFVYNLVVGLLVGIPVFVIYGVLTKVSIGYYFIVPIMLILSSIVPFFIANIISIPVMKFISLIKNKFFIVLTIMIVAVAGGFAIYMLLLRMVIIFMKNADANFSQVLIAVNNLANALFISYPFTNLLINKNIGMSLLYIFLMILILGAIAYLIARFCYYKTMLDSVESQKISKIKHSSNKPHSVFYNLVRKEFLLIFRSVNYSFQYLAMAIAAPIMVYFCNDLASIVAVDKVGNIILPGLTLMVIIIFNTVIVSFSSTAISREGCNFYQTKIIPVSYRYQVFTKFFLYWLVATISSAISCIVVSSVGYIGGVDTVCIYFISQFVIVGLTSFSMKIDLVRPEFKVSGDGEIVSANKNMSFAVFTGLLIAIIFGLFAMVFSFMPLIINGVVLIGNMNHVYYWLLGFSFLFGLVNLLLLFANTDKAYDKLTA